jgi:hypothetical protein
LGGCNVTFVTRNACNVTFVTPFAKAPLARGVPSEANFVELADDGNDLVG